MKNARERKYRVTRARTGRSTADTELIFPDIYLILLEIRTSVTLSGKAVFKTACFHAHTSLGVIDTNSLGTTHSYAAHGSPTSSVPQVDVDGRIVAS
jgi:hypothetical protein